MQLHHLLSVEPLRLGEKRLALNVEVPPDQLDLGTAGIRFASHPHSLLSASRCRYGTTCGNAEW